MPSVFDFTGELDRRANLVLTVTVSPRSLTSLSDWPVRRFRAAVPVGGGRAGGPASSRERGGEDKTKGERPLYVNGTCFACECNDIYQISE